MRVEKRDGSKERRILIGMIVDTVLLGRIAAKWEKEGLFKSRWANTVAGWCVKFYNRYERAPGKSIQGIFESWAEDRGDRDTVEIIERFLDSLSNEYKQLAKESNTDYLADLAAEYFNDVRLLKLAELVQADLEEGKRDQALNRVHRFGKIEMGVGAGVNVMTDPNAIQAAFEDNREPLVVYRGALGNFFGDVFARDSFISFMGPEKRGKSFWLADVAWQGMLQRRKVAFFAVGDMSQNQMMRRFMVRAARRPLKATKPGKPIRYPKFIEHVPGELTANVDFEEREFKKSLNWRDAWKAAQDIMTNKVKSKESLLRLSCHPSSTLTVHGMLSILQGWERESWVPDLIIIDYADILAPPPGMQDSRDRIDATWSQLRGVSQQYHNCVVTATQSDAASYKQETMDQSNFSNDKRKMAHVTAMIGLNQTPAEKENQTMRLNFVVLREDDFITSKCVYVANCLAIGNPAVLSTF